MSFVQFENIVKTYRLSDGRSNSVLSGINGEIGDGEFVALMGPSGSGKSTLLTILGAMNQPTHGRLLIDDIDVYALSDEARADFRREYLGFIFQQHHLLDYLTAAENVALPLAASSISNREKRDRALAALEKVGLVQKYNRLPGQLSGGEQGRVAIARAIVNDAPLILADEPTGALDTRTGAEVIDVFKSLSQSGTTVFMVTHNSQNAAAANRCLHICDGVLDRAVVAVA